eukprot:5791362-Amphidinium_carterae.1
MSSHGAVVEQPQPPLPRLDAMSMESAQIAPTDMETSTQHSVDIESAGPLSYTPHAYLSNKGRNPRIHQNREKHIKESHTKEFSPNRIPEMIKT